MIATIQCVFIYRNWPYLYDSVYSKIIMTTFLFKRLSFLRQSINLSHLYLCYCVLEVIVLKTQKYSRIRHRRFNYKVERRQKMPEEYAVLEYSQDIRQFWIDLCEVQLSVFSPHVTFSPNWLTPRLVVDCPVTNNTGVHNDYYIFHTECPLQWTCTKICTFGENRILTKVSKNIMSAFSKTRRYVDINV